MSSQFFEKALGCGYSKMVLRAEVQHDCEDGCGCTPYVEIDPSDILDVLLHASKDDDEYTCGEYQRRDLKNLIKDLLVEILDPTEGK